MVGLGVIAELEQVLTGFETEQVIIALKRGKAHKISNILLLESEKDIEEKEETLFFPLYFFLVTRVKLTFLASGTLIAISILEEYIETRLEP